MVFVTLLSLFSFPDDATDVITIPYFDKIVHFTFHCVIIILGVLSFRERNSYDFKLMTTLIGLVLFSISYGILIEVLQYYMPFDRAAEIWDVLANTLGAFFGVLLIKNYLSLTTKLK